MKIRIVKSRFPEYWYAKEIGNVFDVKFRKYDDYFIENGGETLPVLEEDCEEVIEHNSQLYHKVDRPVREGDTVLITEFDGNLTNEVRRVKKLYYFNGRNDGSLWIGEKIYDEDFLDTHSDKYVIIEAIEQPVQPTTFTSAPSYAEVSELLHEANKGTLRRALIKQSIKENGAALKRLADDDLIEHNGKQYRKVKRKAAIGELVVVTDFDLYSHMSTYQNTKNGDVFTNKYKASNGRVNTGGVVLDLEEYHVLEPIEQSGQVETLTELDLIANLAQEVAEIKRQLTNAKTDIADLEDRVDENEKDVEEVIGRINDLGDGAEATAVVEFATIEGIIAKLNEAKGRSYRLYDEYKRKDRLELARIQNGKVHTYSEAIELLKEALDHA